MTARVYVHPRDRSSQDAQALVDSLICAHCCNSIPAGMCTCRWYRVEVARRAEMGRVIAEQERILAGVESGRAA